MNKFASLIAKSITGIFFLVLSLSLKSQTITTTATTVAYWSSGSNAIVFGIGNTGTGNVYLTSLSNYCVSGHTGTYTLWYHPTVVAGVPSDISTANGWIQLPVSSTVSSTTNGIIPIFNNINLLLPPGKVYRMALVCSAEGPYYAANGGGPALFTSGNLQVHTQNSSVSPSYAGPFPDVSNGGTPRGFYGSVTFTSATPCSSPIAAGVAAASPGTVCFNQNISLSASSVANGSGIVYQWQVSTDNVNWTDISGATGLTATVKQSDTSWYRFRTVCTNSNDTVYSNLAKVNGPVQFGGNYIIDQTISGAANLYPNTNVFNSFNSAYNAMKCGINSPVVFDVAAGTGPYNEQLVISAVPNTSAVNTVTFNGNGNALTYNATASGERAVIKLKGADYFRFDNLDIVATGTTYGFGVQLFSDADFNIIRNCRITVNSTLTGNSFAPIVISGSETDPVATGTTVCDNNEFRSNILTGGFYGITLTATLSGGANGGNKFVGNQIRDFYQYGMFVQASYNTLIDSNTISRPVRSNSAAAAEGIYFNAQSNAALITRNRIINPFGAIPAATASFNGINFNNCSASTGNESYVINNLIAAITGNGNITGIVNTSSANAYYFHNTISLDDQASVAGGTTRGFSQTGAAAGIAFYNNMVSVTRGGAGPKHAIYLGSNLLIGADNNNYYTNNGAAVGYYGGTRLTLTDWRTATAGSLHDVNSFSFNPVFAGPATGDYCAANAGIDNKAQPLGVDVDINGNARSSTTPDIGAFECTPPPCSVPPVIGTTVISPVSTCQNNPVLLNLNIGAFGSGQSFQWEWADDATPGIFNSLGNPKATPDTAINADSTVWLRVRVGCASSFDYTTPVLLTVNPAFPGGIYTIDHSSATNYVPGQSGGNFASFNDAYNAMAACGITGAVTFNVGGTLPYTEQLKIDSIRGVSAINTVTFNGNGRTIAFATPTTPANAERAVIKLHRADHFIFDSLVIDASAGSSIGYGVQLLNNADSNVFRKCTIISSVAAAATSTNFAGVVINASDVGPTATGNTLCDANIFEGNMITGGYYGVTLVGNTNALVNGNIFRNNIVTEFYSTGFYIAGTDNTIIEDNVIERPTRSLFSTTYGIYVTAVPSSNLYITRNRIRNLSGGLPSSTAQQFGIYHNAAGAPAGRQHIVANNLISDLGGLGLIYAIYNSSSANIHYYHNTISIDSTASTSGFSARGFFQQTGATGIQFKNNIITITRGGSGTKHALYFDNPATDLVSDYNDIHVSGTNTHVGFYNGTNRTTLAQWQAASSKDGHSLNIDPLYINPSAGDYRPAIQTLDNLGTASLSVPVTTDITGLARSTPPDMGAFEFTPKTCVSPPVAGVASVTPSTGLCLQAPISLDITGHSPLGTLTFEWFSGPTAAGPWTSISPVLYGPQFNTLTGVDTWYRAAVSCGASTNYTAPVQVTLNAVLLAGTYSIGNGPTNWTGSPGQNFATFQEAVNAMLCGITGPIVFDVAPGIYSEQIRIPNIRNTSAINTVTFRSSNGLSSSVDLNWASTSATSNYTLKLDTASYFRFRNMTFTALDPVYGRAVEFSGLASFDSITGCVIRTPVVTSTSNANAAVFANAFRGTSNVIKGNTIQNGAMAIFWSGTSAASPAVDHVIDSNFIDGSYFYGIYANNHQKISLDKNMIRMSAPLAATSYAIYSNDCDSVYSISKNRIEITGTSTTVFGIYANNNDHASVSGKSLINANIITANTGNTGNVWGLYFSNGNPPTAAHTVVNNVISIHTTALTSYGIYSNNASNGRYLHNTINLTSPAAAVSNACARFENAGASGIEVRNNIFSNKGGGRALVINNTNDGNLSNYNLLYSAGSVLAQRLTPAGTYGNLAAWTTATGNDKYSIVYGPALLADLRPDVSSPEVWAIHGRGVQIKGNTSDADDQYRPDSLTAGVPDLGAYEFLPTAPPTILIATPPVPAINTTQTFMYGTDTVMKIDWGAVVPTSITAQRYSGVPPGNRPYPSVKDSMFFYTKVNLPTGSPNIYEYNVRVFYLDPWQGSIPQQHMIGLGRIDIGSGLWLVGFNSKTDTKTKEISQDNLKGIDRFTGFINPYAPPVLPDKDSSSRGKRFWVGYQKSWNFSNGNAQNMVLYLSTTSQPATVEVKINGTSWARTYVIPPFTTKASDIIPKGGADDARLLAEGQYNKGISIVSDVPITAYAHIYADANSGATMLFPTGVWGYEYYTLNNKQYYGSDAANANTVIMVIADNDNTQVEITPSVPTLGGKAAGVTYTVVLNKGEVYQVLGATLSGSRGEDLTGTKIRSVSNSAGTCYPIAVFSGSTRTGIACGSGNGSSGDLLLQQTFPYSAWGKKYLTAPSSNSSSINSFHTNVYRVLVKDASTVVTRNGVTLTGLQNSRYYQFESNSADVIVADKPVMVAQYMASSGDCPNTSGNGDPSSFIMSPVEQAIKGFSGFYRNNLSSISSNYLCIVLPTNGMNSLKIDGIPWASIPAGEKHSYLHPNAAGYTVAIKKWNAGAGQSSVESDSAYTGTVYGLGSVESYGYNVGTLVRNLRALGIINNSFSASGTPNDFTCTGSPFKLSAYLAVIPTKLTWKIGSVANVTPARDTTINNPVPTSTTSINGTTYYIFQLDQQYSFSIPGLYGIPVEYEHPDIESCDHKGVDLFYVQVVPAPKPSFISTVFAGCEGDIATLTSSNNTSTGLPISQWEWTFHTGATASGPTTSFTYPAAGDFQVNLHTVTPDGCIADSLHPVKVNPRPAIAVVQDSVSVCPGSSVQYDIQSPGTGVIYKWYRAASGGTEISSSADTLVGTNGTSLSISNVTTSGDYWIEATSPFGCVSTSRKQVKLRLLPPLAPTTISFADADRTINSVTFHWTAVSGAGSYQVSIDNGTNWITPSTGTAGLSHTVTGLKPMQEVCIKVRVQGVLACQTSETPAVCARTRPEDIFIPNTFTPNGDGKNDVLSAYGFGIQSVQFLVFNQWGEKIHETNNSNVNASTGEVVLWDGKYQGSVQPVGVYVYAAKITLKDGTVINKSGALNIIR